MLPEPAIQDLRHIFAKVRPDFGASLDGCDGEDGHAHPLVSYPPKVPVSRLASSLKGVSSRRLRSFRSETAGRCRKGALRSPSCFAASRGGAPPDIIRQHSGQQRVARKPRQVACALYPRPEGRGFTAHWIK